MNKQGKDILIENLSLAALLGVMALIVAAASFFLDRLGESRERAALTRVSGSQRIGLAVRSSDSSFKRVFPIVLRGKTYYGAVLSLRSHGGTARLAAIMAKDGSLDSVGLLDATPVDLPFSREGWFSEFLGKGGADSFPGRKEELRKPEAISGATESFMVSGAVLDRLSRTVTRLAAVKGGN